MLSTFLIPATVNMRRRGLVACGIFCILLPLVIGAPANDDLLKQQIASQMLRGDGDFWNFNQGKPYEGYPYRRPWMPVQNYQKRFDSLSGDAFGLQKRNFDQIDSSGFGSFVKKRNFDEIDRTSLGFHKKRNFDEIDRTGFGSFV